MDAKDLRCPTTSTSSYGSESHTLPELIVGRDRDAALSRRCSFVSGSSFSLCAAAAFIWAAPCRRHAWAVDCSLGSSTQLWHTQFRQLFADDLLVFVNVFFFLTLQSANLARPAEGIFMRQQHNASFVPTRWRLISAMLPAASASVLSASLKALHSGIITSDSVLPKTAIFPQKEGRKREISNESARGSSLRETKV